MLTVVIVLTEPRAAMAECLFRELDEIVPWGPSLGMEPRVLLQAGLLSPKLVSNNHPPPEGRSNSRKGAFRRCMVKGRFCPTSLLVRPNTRGHYAVNSPQVQP